MAEMDSQTDRQAGKTGKEVADASCYVGPESKSSLTAAKHHHRRQSAEAEGWPLVAGDRLGVIVFVGCVTAMYTAAGGLLVSILTDQGQVSGPHQQRLSLLIYP